MKKLILFLSILIQSKIINAIEIQGLIYDDLNKPINKFTIEINGKIINFDSHKFKLSTEDASLYQLKITADNYYPSIQTISHYELNQFSTSSVLDKHSLPAIHLTKKQPKRVMFAFGGDVMMGRRYSKPYFNEEKLIDLDKENRILDQTKSILKHIKPYMEIADFSAVNLESQVSKTKPKNRAPKSVTFHSPPETLSALQWAGIDYVTLGNNHIFDYVDEGLVSTLKHLKNSGLAYSGAGLNQEQALKAHNQSLNDQDYSFLGFVGWEGSFTPNQVATDLKGGSAFGTSENIISTVNREDKDGNAVVLQYHGSLEYSNGPTGMTESRLKTAIDEGADLIIAHHPHVTQGFEIYNGKLIAYSMGNFVFDQYFYATPHSFVLYVWMDGEEFHRAEIVPVYLKGYKPTPATGIQRNTLSKRIKHLSKKRDILTSQSGGHLVINPNQKPNNTKPLKQEKTLNAGDQHFALYDFPINGTLENVSNSENLRYRLGKNQINGGDFESFNSFDSSERGLLIENAQLDSSNSHSGHSSIKLDLNNSQPSRVAMRNFRRVFNAASPMSFSSKISTNQDVKVNAFIQYRKTRDKFFDAFKNDIKLISSTHVKASDQWQTVNFNFNLPRVGYRSYRVIFEFESNDSVNEKSIVLVDDIELIQWQGHYNKPNQLTFDKEILGLATHIGVEKIQSKKVSFEMDYLD